MKKTLINRIKSLFEEYGRNEFSFFYGRSFTITYDYGKYDVLAVSDADEDGVTIDCVGYSSFGLRVLNLNDLPTNTIKKILKKIEENLDNE